MSIERVVVVLTPLFGAASAWLSGIIAQNVPGAPQITASDLTAIQIAGFTAAAAAALKWLHGRQKYVQLTDDAKKDLDAAVEKVHSFITEYPQAGAGLDDIKTVLEQHTAQVEQSIEQHVPAAVGQALQALFAQLGQAPPAAATEAATPAPPPPLATA